MLLLLQSIMVAGLDYSVSDNTVTFSTQSEKPLAQVFTSFDGDVAACEARTGQCLNTQGKEVRLKSCAITYGGACSCSIDTLCTGGASFNSCVDGDVRCSSRTQQECQNGVWEDIKTCASGTVCRELGGNTLTCVGQNSAQARGVDCTSGEERCGVLPGTRQLAPQTCSSGEWVFTGEKCVNGAVCATDTGDAFCELPETLRSPFNECEANIDCNPTILSKFECVLAVDEINTKQCIDCGSDGVCTKSCAKDPDCAQGENNGVSTSCFDRGDCIQLSTPLKEDLTKLGLIEEEVKQGFDGTIAGKSKEVLEELAAQEDAYFTGVATSNDYNASLGAGFSLVNIVGFSMIILGTLLVIFLRLNLFGAAMAIIGLIILIGGRLL